MTRLNIIVKFISRDGRPGAEFDHTDLGSEDDITPENVEIVSHDPDTGLTTAVATFRDEAHAWEWWEAVDASAGLWFSIVGMGPSALGEGVLRNNFCNALCA